MSNEEKKEGEEEEQQQEEIQEEPKEEKLIVMKKGDYNVHILIEEVKNLIEIEEGSPPWPSVKMTVFGKSKRTSKVKKPVDNYIFNEHFYFDKTNLTEEMLDSEKVLIEVYDSKHSKRKDYFGIYEIDFGYVYNQEDHALHNVWIGLANPESEDISKIRGYLKISISVLHDSNQRVELEAIETEISNCIIPSQIKQTYKQISFYFFRGEDFPDMDSDDILKNNIFTKKTKSCDGYIEVKYMGIMRKTTPVSMDKNDQNRIKWNEIIDIPATQPAISQKVLLVVKDDDKIGFDIVGSIEVKIDDIYKGKYNEYQYLDIYGSPINKRGGIFDLVNYNAEIGTKWNGRILMKCTVSDVGAPVAKVHKIPKDIVDDAYNHSRKYIWRIWVRIISAMYLPKDNKEYSIRISIQEKTELLSYKKAINGSIDFNETRNILLNTFSGDKFELPEMFIYLVDKANNDLKKNVCFTRIRASEFHLNKDIIVIKLLPDPFINKCENNTMISGIIKCKICVYNDGEKKLIPTEKEFNEGGIMPLLKTFGKKPSKVLDMDDLENLKDEEDEPEPEPIINDNKNTFTILALVYMSRGLVSAESSGVSDPFVRIKYEDQTHDTHAKNNTMNGIWNEKLEFKNIRMKLDDITTWPIFQIAVFDKNKVKSNVPLGYNYLWLNDSAYTLNDAELREPKWHKLFLPKSNKQQGQILLSFYILDKEHENIIPNIRIEHKVTLYDFEINILGLRQLKPLGIIGIKKPFIKFDLNSLNVTGNPEDAHANIQTVPVSGGANPTINTIIKFDVKLPEKDIFMPELQCEVYDHVLAGLHNSLLGVFSIDLKRIIKKTRRQIDEDLTAVRKKLGESKIEEFIKASLRKGNIDIYNLSKNFAAKQNGMLEKDDNNIISTNDNNKINNNQEEDVNDPFDIKNMADPLSQLKEVEEREIEGKELTDLSKEINKENDKKEEDDDSDKNSEDNLIDEKKDVIDMKTVKINEIQIPIPISDKKISLRKTIKVKGDFVKENLNNPNYFVAFPIIKPYKIPGYNSKPKPEPKEEKIEEEKPEQMQKLEEKKDDIIKIEEKQNGQLNKIQEVENGEEIEEEKVQKEFFIEDTSLAPDSRFYFEVGYLLKVEHELAPEDSTKHYRRKYGYPLEHCPELNLKSPFHVRKIRRGKFSDKAQITDLFEALRDVDSKVIYSYGKEIIKDDTSSKNSEASQLSQVGFLDDKNKDEKYYGKFKGLIRIVEKEKKLDYDNEIKKCQEQGGI